MKTITSRGQTIEVPSYLEELTPEQYQYYCFLVYALTSKAITPEYFRIRWLSYLIGMKKADYTILKSEYRDEIESQSSFIDNFSTGSDDKFFPTLDTVVNLLPEYKGYKGPGVLLQGVSFGEFVECYSIFETLDLSDSDELFKGYEHIARILYHIPEGEKVPELLLFHAPRLFSNIWNAIQRGPIEMNGKKIDFRIIFKSTGSTRPDDKTGWTGIIFEIATAGLFGNVEQVEKVDMWSVLLYLYRCKFEYINEKRNT